MHLKQQNTTIQYLTELVGLDELEDDDNEIK